MKKLFRIGNFKMKGSILFFLFTIYFTPFNLHAQSWSALGTGVNSSVNALTIYEGSLIAGGVFDSAGGIQARSIAAWNGFKWDSLREGIVGTVSALAVLNDTLLFAGGTFNQAGFFNVNNIAQWNGSYWYSVSTGVGGSIAALCAYKGNVIIGGQFNTVGPGIPVHNLAIWEYAIGMYSTLDSGFNNTVNALLVYNDTLIAAGAFDSAGKKPIKYIAKWGGTSWLPIGKGMNGTVNTLCNYNGYLIAGGVFDSAGGNPANNIAVWTGTSWSPIGSGIGNSCTALDTFNGAIIAGSSTANCIGQWKVSSWSNLGFGLGGQANCLTLFNGDLVAGGQFNTAGGKPANNIALWSDPLGINNIGDGAEIVNVYPNPCNGFFTIEFNKEESSTNNNIQIYNMLGDKIYSAKLVIDNSKSLIDIDNQPAGIYLYRIVSEEGSIITTGKISIQK